MNRKNVLLHLPIILFLTVLARPSDASGQEVDLFPNSLSVDTLESVPFTYLPIGSCGMFLTPPDQPFLLVRDSAVFAELLESKRFIGQCKDLVLPDVNYTRHAVVGFEVLVDCHGREVVSLTRDTAAGVYRVVVDSYYGGCHGMTSHGYWLLIPALKKGEKVELQERDHDRRRYWDE